MSLVLGLCVVCAVCAAIHDVQAASPKIKVATDGVVLDVRPIVSGNVATTEVRFGVNKIKGFRTYNLQLGNGVSVPIQLPMRSIYEVHTTVAIPLVRASFGSDIHTGWISMAGVDRAVNLAQTHNRPFLFLEKSSSGSARDRRLARAYAGFTGFKGFVRIEKDIDDEIQPPELSAGLKKAAKMYPDERAPRLACIDRKGRVLGVIPYGTSKRQFSKKAKGFANLFVTLSVLDKDIAVGDKLVELGRFNAALKVYKHVAKCDPKEKFYPALVKNKQGEINTAAQIRLEKTEKLLAKGDRVAAAQMVNPIIEDGGDFEFVKRAKALKQRCRN